MKISRRLFFAGRVGFWAWAWFWERFSIILLIIGGLLPVIAWAVLTIWWLFPAAVIWHHQKTPSLELRHAWHALTGRINPCRHGWIKRGYLTTDRCKDC